MKTMFSKFALAAALAAVFSFSCSDEGGDNDKGNDIRNYKIVGIGSQIWMAENLNYAVAGSECLDNKPANCAKYGRLYNWAMAMTVCPDGWHLPTKAEWEKLADYIERDIGCTDCDAKHLKSASGWFENNNGTDSYGFAALPGGSGSNTYRHTDKSIGIWWSATATSSDGGAYSFEISILNDASFWMQYFKTGLYSVRCIKD